MNILDKIKLIIEAKSFYVKKITFYVPLPSRRILLGNKVLLKELFKRELKAKKILKYKRDEQRFGWVVWYI